MAAYRSGLFVAGAACNRLILGFVLEQVLEHGNRMLGSCMLYCRM